RPSSAELEAVETYLRAHPRGPLRALPGDLVARFRAMAESMQSTTEEVATEADVPPAVARYMTGQGLWPRGCVWPALAHLEWRAAGVEVEARGAKDSDPMGITGAFAALA